MARTRPAELSRRSIARLHVSIRAAELSDTLVSLVRTDDEGRPGELADRARAIVVMAEQLLAQAVLAERHRGTSWAELGETLDVSKQGAQQRYGAALDEWNEALDHAMQPASGAIVARVVPGEGPETPQQHAERLDDWVVRRAGNRASQKRAVSAGLEAASLIERERNLVALARRMAGSTDADTLRPYLECKAALLAELAAERRGDPTAAEKAAAAQRELNGLGAAKKRSRRHDVN